MSRLYLHHDSSTDLPAPKLSSARLPTPPLACPLGSRAALACSDAAFRSAARSARCSLADPSLARVQGIDKDLGLVGTQFNTAISVLFAGYIIGQVPSNILLSRSRPSLYLPAFVCLWGTVSAATAAANSYSHLVVIRFFLGVTEAPYFPGILFFLSSWYTKKELAVSHERSE